MENKTEDILNKLKNEFPGGTLSYRFENEYHKFRIDDKRLSYCLYIDRDFVDDLNKNDLIEMINIYKVIDKFKESKKSRWLYLYDTGIRDVDEDFTK